MRTARQRLKNWRRFVRWRWIRTWRHLRKNSRRPASPPVLDDDPLKEEFFVPFGRYERDRATPYPANEVLVGREKQRAKLLDLLLSVGPRGAYLVTGHRGSGKTSFVEYCLREYEESLYGRFLQRNIGRAMFWDRFGLIGLVFVLVMTGLLLSEALAEVLADPVRVPGVFAGLRFPAVVVALALTLLLSYPLFLAQAAFRGAFPRHEITRFGLLRRAALPSFSLYVLLLVWEDNPTILAGQLLLVGTHLFLLHSIVFWSFEKLERSQESAVDSPLESIRTTSWWQQTVSLLLIGMAALLWIFDLFPDGIAECLALSSSALLVTLLVRLLPELVYRDRRRPRSTAALHSSARWLLLAVLVMLGALLLVGTARMLGDPRIQIFLALQVVALVVTAIIAGQGSPAHFHPQPKRLLLFKGFALTLLGIQLLHPAIRFVWTTVGRMLERSGWWITVRPAFAADAATTLFADAASDLAWVVLVVLGLVLLFLMEYEWIVRPYSPAREDLSLHDAPTELDTTSAKMYSRSRHEFREILHATFFWRVYSLWLPLLRVRVNLGFQELDQKLVIEAMLNGLREEFRRAFLRWSGTFTAVRRLLGLLILALIALWAGDQWFGATSAQLRSVTEDAASPPSPSRCADVLREPRRWTPLWLACRSGDALVRALQWAPLAGPYDARPRVEGPNALQLLLGLRLSDEDFRRQSIFDVRLYHLLTFLLLLALVSLVARWWQPLPFREIDDRMTHVLDGLSSRLREESRPDRITSWLNAIRGHEMVEAKEGGPFDPRTIELHFLSILEDVQGAQLRMPFGTTPRVTLPHAEVIFIFDELDKIGVASRALGEDDEDGPEAAKEPLDQERERSRALHQLFSDLKNLISSGHARFLFVGGRNLHDEWLADSSARRPLLTNIFTSEIYRGKRLSVRCRGIRAPPTLPRRGAASLGRAASAAPALLVAGRGRPACRLRARALRALRRAQADGAPATAGHAAAVARDLAVVEDQDLV